MRTPEEIEPTAYVNARQHRCVQCGRVDVWGEGWMQYGTLDECMFVTCSDACRDARDPHWAQQIVGRR